MYLLAVLLTRRCRAGDMAGLRPLGVRLGWRESKRGRIRLDGAPPATGPATAPQEDTRETGGHSGLRTPVAWRTAVWPNLRWSAGAALGRGAGVDPKFL